MAKEVMGAQMLLGLLAEDKLPKELYPYVEELISKNANASVRMQASGYFKSKKGVEEYSIPDIVKLKADVNSGKKLFEKNCATCHRVKETGTEIGPDLTSIKNKFDRNTLLEAIINPDAGIVFGYEPWTISLTDGQSFFGFLVADGERTVTIKDLTGNKHVIETSRIRSRKKQEKSLMPAPDGLGLKEQDLVDLSEYLLTVK